MDHIYFETLMFWEIHAPKETFQILNESFLKKCKVIIYGHLVNVIIFQDYRP